jgi:hypothetical protein
MSCIGKRLIDPGQDADSARTKHPAGYKIRLELNQRDFTDQGFIDNYSGSPPGSGHNCELNIIRRISNNVQAGNIGFLELAGIENIARLASASPLAKATRRRKLLPRSLQLALRCPLAAWS